MAVLLIKGTAVLFWLCFSASPRLPRPAQNQPQCIRCLSFGLVDGVDVAVGGFEPGVTEAGGYVFDVRAV